MASSMLTIPLPCSTGHCMWPPFPTIAVCGNCTESIFRTSCDLHNGCTYTMPTGTSVTKPNGDVSDFDFIVAPSNGSIHTFNSDDRALFSVFDIISVSQTAGKARVESHECALWFCLESLNATVTNGVQDSAVIAHWPKTKYSPETNGHFDELTFVDIPPELHVHNKTRYTIPVDSVHALRGFMDSLMTGHASSIGGVVKYSSDWIEAIHSTTSDLDNWIARLSLSMTNNIRQSGSLSDRQSFKYSGTAFIAASHVKVNWYWVIYPLTLMVLAFCYLGKDSP